MTKKIMIPLGMRKGHEDTVPFALIDIQAEILGHRNDLQDSKHLPKIGNVRMVPLDMVRVTPISRRKISNAKIWFSCGAIYTGKGADK